MRTSLTSFARGRGCCHQRRRSHGFTLLYILMAFTVLCAFAAFGVDWGRAQIVKSELMLAADAASRAAVSQLPYGITAVQNAAVTWGARNTADGSSVVIDPINDVEFGSWDTKTRTFSVLSGSARNNANAVRVTARRVASNGNATPLVFGTIFGAGSIDIKSTATACSSTSGFAIVGLSSFATSGTVQIDSWNSNSGSYSSFPMNSDGDVSTNGSAALSSGTVIKGDVHPGAGKTVSGGSVSGSTSPLSSPLNYPPPDPGPAVTINNNSSLPSVYFNSSTRDFTIPSGKTLSIPGGVYYVNNIDWDTAHITFTGPVTFYITGSNFNGHNNFITTYQNKPANLKFEVTGSCVVTYDFDQPCYAVVYAPLADVTTMGMSDDYGAIIGKTLVLKSGWHVDEALGGAGVPGAPMTVK